MKLAITRNGMGTMRTQGLALALAASMVAPGLLAGCGGGNQQSQAPAMGNYNPNGGQRPAMQGQRPQQGMSGGQKALLLGGAALAYYLWKKKRNAQNQPLPQGVQLYRSKNGGIYYRDARNPQQPIYVVPPQGQPFNTQLQVDPREVQGLGLEGYQGYNGATSGTGLNDVLNQVPLYGR